MKLLFPTVLLLTAPAWAQNPVTVRVLDATGAPVSNALVEVQTWGDGDKPVPAATTDTNGAATFSLPAKPEPKKPTGRIVVAAKGFAFAGTSLVGENLEIRLEKGATWHGKVLDETGKPVENAAINISGAMPQGDWEHGVWLVSGKISALYTTKSGADGSFQLEDVPATLGLNYGVKHPRFAVAQRGDVSAGAEEIVNLVPGGTLRGRMLDVEGKPLAKIAVYATSVPRGEGGNGTVTDENGNFSIESLGAGQYHVGAQPPDDAKWVLPDSATVMVAVGKTSDVPDLRAITGVEIRGTVRAAATNKPLAGAGIIAQQNNETSAYKTSDAAGHFVLRVAPGSYKVYVSGTPTGFLRPSTQKSVEVGETAPSEVVFELQPAVTIRGVTLDEAGQPLAAHLKVGWDGEIESDENGQWEYPLQDNETLRLGGGDDETGYFEVLAPAKIEPTERGAITVKVRQVPWNTLAGRTVSPDGKPIEGVKVTATFYVPIGGDAFTTATRTATSDAQGQFLLPKIREGRELKIDAKKAGLALQSGGEVTRTGATWKASNLVLSALDRTIEGTTSPGARVVTMGREIVADGEGKFKFEGLAAGDTLVFAAKDGQFGSNLNAAQRIELQKQGLQGVDDALANEIWQEVARDGKGKDFYALDWVKMRLGEGADTGDTFKSRWEKALAVKDGELTLLSVLATWDGKTDIDLVVDTLESLTDPNTKVYGFLVAATRSDDKTLGARAIEVSEADFAHAPKTAWWRVRSLYRAVVVAQKFGEEKASDFALNRAIAYTMANHGEKSVSARSRYTEGRDEMYAKQSPVIAKASPALLRQLLETIESDNGYGIQALAEAIPVVARKQGALAALPFLDELEKMPEPTLQGEGNSAEMKPEWAFGQAAIPVIRLLGQTSPDDALTLARRVKSEQYRAQALATAARFQTGEAAAKLWREAVEGARGEEAPGFAAQAWELDPKLGAELFEIARNRVESDSKRGMGDAGRLWPAFAWNFARVDAAQARLILEKSWGAALAQKADGSGLGEIARAMSVVDAKRAVEMALAIPAGDQNFWSLEARRKIGQYVAMSQDKRRNLSFDRWGATDTWDGDESDGDWLR